jgi:hypothetical protein
MTASNAMVLWTRQWTFSSWFWPRLDSSVDANVSEKLTASIFRVRFSGTLATTDESARHQNTDEHNHEHANEALRSTGGKYFDDRQGNQYFSPFSACSLCCWGPEGAYHYEGYSNPRRPSYPPRLKADPAAAGFVMVTWSQLLICVGAFGCSRHDPRAQLGTQEKASQIYKAAPQSRIMSNWKSLLNPHPS